MTMNCREVENGLIELLFGEPDDEREAILHRHLALCESCRREERRLLSIRENLRSGEESAGPELRRRIREALPRRSRRGVFALLERPVPAYIAAAACLAGVLLARGFPERPAREGAPRPAATVIDEGPVPFAVAGSYETGVMWEFLSTDSL